MKIFVIRRIMEFVIEFLKKYGEVEVNLYDRLMIREEFLKVIVDKDVVLIQFVDKVDSEFFDYVLNVKIVVNYVVGYDNIDIEEVIRRGVYVINMLDVLINVIVEFVWVLLFAAVRRIVEVDKFMRGGYYKGWGLMFFLGKGVIGKIFGVIGVGRIGQVFVRMLKGFNMKILYYDFERKESFEKEMGVQFVLLDEFLKEVDFILIYVLFILQIRYLIGEREFFFMKLLVILINIVCGLIVDEKVLVKVLKEKKIYAVGFDVYEREFEFELELVEFDNVVMFFYIGFVIEELRFDMVMFAVNNIVDFIEGRVLRIFVNKEVLNKK